MGLTGYTMCGIAVVAVTRDAGPLLLQGLHDVVAPDAVDVVDPPHTSSYPRSPNGALSALRSWSRRSAGLRRWYFGGVITHERYRNWRAANKVLA